MAALSSHPYRRSGSFDIIHKEPMPARVLQNLKSVLVDYFKLTKGNLWHQLDSHSTCMLNFA